MTIVKYPAFITDEQRGMMIDTLREQAYNNILEDPDRIEKYIEDNSDVIQDILFRHGAYKKHPEEAEALEVFVKIGAEIVSNVLMGIESMAEEDVEHQNEL